MGARALEPPRVGWLEHASAADVETAWRHGEGNVSEPVCALDALMETRRSFSRRDLAKFVKERTADEEQFLVALGRVEFLNWHCTAQHPVTMARNVFRSADVGWLGGAE